MDEIVVLDRGRVAERGSHDDLIRVGGLYQQMQQLLLRLAAPRLVDS